MIDWTQTTLTGSIALMFGALVAFLSHLTAVRSREDGWYKEFRELYREFWNGEDMQEVRTWIANDEAYEGLEPTLKLWSRENRKQVPEKDYVKLDRLDRFFSLLVRILDLGDRKTKEPQRKLFDDLLFSYWISKIKGRRSLYAYAVVAWSPLSKHFDKVETKRD